jgi:NAD(P)-dependent dehydrogenase (short-subunit alcohol dehydrogenase family)
MADMASPDGPSHAVVLTGAAGVLGKAMALALLRAGHRVLLTDLDDAQLRQIVEASGAETGRAVPCAADLTAPASPERVARAALDAFGRIDMLVNNAAFTAFAAWPDGRLVPDPWTLETAFARRFFETNMIAPHALTSVVLPGMIAQCWGRVVNITCSYDTMQRIFPYGATKAALEAYTASLEARLTNTGVTANTVNPGGPVATALHMAKNPGRKWVEPEVMNPVILWLASDASDGIGGRRYVGTKWDPEVPWSVALERASGPMTWKGFGDEALK